MAALVASLKEIRCRCARLFSFSATSSSRVRVVRIEASQCLFEMLSGCSDGNRVTLPLPEQIHVQRSMKVANVAFLIAGQTEAWAVGGAETFLHHRDVTYILIEKVSELHV